jgi:hypothetical protein
MIMLRRPFSRFAVELVKGCAILDKRMEQKPKPSLAVLGRAKMSYPDPKLVEEARKRGLAVPDSHVSMGSPLYVDRKTGKVTSAKPGKGERKI